MDTAPNDPYVRRVATDTICVSRLLPTSAERVWDYITDPALRRLWLADGPFDLKAGGGVELVFHNAALTQDDIEIPAHHLRNAGEITMTGEILRCERPHLLEFNWDMGQEMPTTVRFALEPRGDATLLTITHARVETRGLMLSIACGWHTHLDILAARVEGRPHTGFWRQIVALEPVYERRIPA